MADSLEPLNDLHLLDRWRTGNRAAGEILFQRHYKALFRFFKNKVDDDDIQDQLQETFLACLKNVAGFRGHSTFKTYLFKIARNILYAYWQGRKKSQERLDFSVSSLADLGITPTSRIADGQLRNLLLQALRRLPLEHQLLLEHRFWENMSVDEIAETFQIKKDATYARLSRAYKVLRTHLESLSSEANLSLEVLDDLDSWARSIHDGSEDVDHIDDGRARESAR